ncbi:MAG: ATP-binding cassette domain-containing protein [Thermoleophilia bacterium]|nr:ATP-binding cassette domain-containing protein [Thermoleophilia bacterium]
MAAGELVCILGRSGSGKTTLLRIVAGLEAPSAGSVWIGDSRVRGPGPHVGMVFQEPNLFPWRTVEANIALGLECMPIGKGERREIVAHFVTLMGLQGFERRYPHELSGDCVSGLRSLEPLPLARASC